MRTKGLLIISLIVLTYGCKNLESPVRGDSCSFFTLHSLELTLQELTKTTITYDSSSNVIKSVWQTDDCSFVTDLYGSACFVASPDASGMASGAFSGSLSVNTAATDLFVIYPYGRCSLQNGHISVNLPSLQEESNAGNYDIKASSTSIEETSETVSEYSLRLHNLVSIILASISLPDDLAGFNLNGEKFLSFTILSNKPICGDALLENSEEGLTLCNFNKNELVYSFNGTDNATQKKRAIIFVAPVSFNENDTVDYIIETTNYLIKFRLNPLLDLEAGLFYTGSFNLRNSAWIFNPVEVTAEREYTVFEKNPSNPRIDKIESTPTTATIHWIEPQNNPGYVDYIVGIYSDASCTTNIRGDYTLTLDTNDPKSFTFTGLQSDTDYYVRVKGNKFRNKTDWSSVITVRTQPEFIANEHSLSLISFDKCCWGGDYLHLALGTRPQTDTQSNLIDGWNNCYTTISASGNISTSYTGYTRLAGSFSANYSAMLSELGLEGWTFNNVYMRPGYAQVGSGSSASLKSPALTNLPSGLHTVAVAFKAVPFTSSGSKSGSVTVTCNSSGGTVVGTQTVNLASTPSIPDDLPEWESFSLSFNNVPSGSTITFSNEGTANDFCIDEIEISSDDVLVPISHDPGNNVYGLITDTSGNPLSGVVVSDGYVVTATAADGVYQFNSTKANGYVFISQPQGYEVALDGVFPQFWQPLESDTAIEERHDFQLSPVSNSDCVILALGDFHLCNRNALYDLQQFRMQVGELKSTVQALQAQGKKVYGLTLGDMTWDIYWDNSSGYGGCNFDLAAYRNEVNNDFAGVTFPIWHTIGNHDHAYFYTGDWDTVIPYKQTLGPTYYSFNAGGYHIISLDNVICNNDGTTGGRDDSPGLTSDILSWLQADIARVPSGMPVIVSMHEQAYSPTNPTGGYSSETYASSLTSALSGRNIHIVTGHTHNINNVPVNSSLYEHNAGALCATWWWTGRFSITSEASWGGGTSLSDTYHIGRDGSPAGYTVYNLDNGSMTWKYKAFGLSENRQFKTYDRNQFTLKASTWCPNASSTYQTNFETLAAKQPDYSYAKAAGESLGFLQGSVPKNMVYINVWNYDPGWTITVKEGNTNLTVTKLTNAYDPMHMVAYPATRYNSKNDVTSTFVTCKTQHLFRVTASSASSTLTITVTDRFGNTYTETMTRPKAFGVNWD